MNYNKKTVRDVDVAGKKVLLRCDFNVPQDKETGAITSDKRIVAALPTIKKLVADGAKELILIAQDTSRYGIDLYGEYSLAKLMRRLCAIEGLRWLRVLYCYPDSITDELLEVMAREEKIVPYIDLPLQHASGKILKAMNRRGDRQSLTALMKKIREKVPGVVLRTTLIAGFPGETGRASPR